MHQLGCGGLQRFGMNLSCKPSGLIIAVDRLLQRLIGRPRRHACDSAPERGSNPLNTLASQRLAQELLVLRSRMLGQISRRFEPYFRRF